jgi:glyoxylase-like metal-dependent hydrolase (beta-lactamase superfamily II)
MHWSAAKRKEMLIRPFPKVDNIHAFALPLPQFPHLITANIYAIGRGPITLIDTGPKLPGSLETLRENLGSVGFGFSDIERILLTHAHVDHAGLVLKISEASERPIECFIHTEDRWRILRDNYQEQIWNEEAERFCALMNMPSNEIEKARNYHFSLRALFDPLEDISTMEDGDEFVGDGYRLIAIHTPGHTSGGCCLYEPSQKILFSGDSIIKHMAPITLTEMKPGRPKNQNYKCLSAFWNSLEKLKRIDIRFVFSGHGEYIEDFQSLGVSYISHHDRRLELLWGALKKGTRTLYDVIDDLFLEYPESGVFLPMIQTFAHLEILIDQGKAELVDPGPPVLYRAL